VGLVPFAAEESHPTLALLEPCTLRGHNKLPAPSVSSIVQARLIRGVHARHQTSTRFNRVQQAGRKRFNKNHLESTKFTRVQQGLAPGSGPGGRWCKSTRCSGSFWWPIPRLPLVVSITRLGHYATEKPTHGWPSFQGAGHLTFIR